MRRILFFVFFLSLVGGCGDREIADKIPPQIMMVSFIPYYEDNAPFNITPTSNGSLAGWFGDPDVHTGGCIYSAPELGSKGENAERFLDIAHRNGDRSYNRYENFYKYGNRSCCANNYREVRVKCLNAAWDQSHPAGSSLDDLFAIEYSSYAEYVCKGYLEHVQKLQTYRKTLSVLDESDMTMIKPNFSLYYDSTPPPGSYEIEVTLVTTEGVEKTAACTLIIG